MAWAPPGNTRALPGRQEVPSIFTCCAPSMCNTDHCVLLEVQVSKPDGTVFNPTPRQPNRRVHFETVATPIDKCGVEPELWGCSADYNDITTIPGIQLWQGLAYKGMLPAEKPNTNTTTYPRRLTGTSG